MLNIFFSLLFLFSVVSFGQLYSPLELPKHEETNLENPVEFRWINLGDSVEYELQVSIEPVFNSVGFDTPVLREILKTNHFKWNGAKPGMKYYWSVKISGYGWYKPIHVFQTRLSKPSGLKTTFDRDSVIFTWNVDTKADAYRIQVSSSDNDWDKENGFAQAIMINQKIYINSFKMKIPKGVNKLLWSVRVGSFKYYHSVYAKPTEVNFKK